MPRAIELLQQGRNEELWQMGCGFISLTTEQFMAIQKRLLLEQIELLNHCAFGNKVMRGAQPETIEEFRQQVPLTTYADYFPELAEKREDILPRKPALWVHTSGRSGEHPCKWVPITPVYAHVLTEVMCGLAILSTCKGWGDLSALHDHPKIVYTVAPRPYMSGALASLLQEQVTADYLPPLDEAEGLPFEDRIKLGLQQALSRGIDYFFGLSLVLAAIGDKFSQSSDKVDIRPFLTQPKALLRLTKGLVKSKLARRPMLPKDLWSVKGIISSGLDSMVYKEKIREFWGRCPLDIYSSTEGGIIATQTWDYDSMTFIPSLNFLEFIPEEEHWKWQLDHSYWPKTVLLDEVEAGENYEMVITNFHGGAMVRYRIGDMVKITSLRNEKLGIAIPQMVFERRADDLLDFVTIRLTEKSIWQAIENAGIAYEDWIARKKVGEPALQLFIELKDGYQAGEANIAAAVYEQIMNSNNDSYATSSVHEDLTDMINFRVEATLLPSGAFTNYTSQMQAEGADLAHLKPLHINPSDKVLSLLLAKPEAAPEVKVEAEAVTIR
ncbi:MAG: GH3 auxin-responsive promoter family protein [Dehalococcoidia bacterium]|nr:MAG: GH3 auxin-responsive promoter family protein [Dehalococcoidia bacterium]